MQPPGFVAVHAKQKTRTGSIKTHSHIINFTPQCNSELSFMYQPANYALTLKLIYSQEKVLFF